MATPSEVNAFLLKIKAKVVMQELHFAPRNLAGITSLGLSFDNVDDIILGLTSQDYSKGPEADRDGSPGEIWIFGATLDNLMVYIKFKIDGDDARCLSFHEAESTLAFPLRQASQTERGQQ